MTDFVEISKDDRWANKWGGVFIRDEFDGVPDHYSHMSDKSGVPELKQIAAVQSVAPLSESAQAKFDQGALAPALMWPVNAAKDQAAAPFVTAALAALVLVPMVYPAINVTGALLSGYTAGGAVYYFQVKPAANDSHRETGEVEKFVLRRDQELEQGKPAIFLAS